MCTGNKPNCYYRCSGCPDFEFDEGPEEVLLDMMCTQCKHMFQTVGTLDEETGLRTWSPATCPKCGDKRIVLNTYV